MNNYIVAYFCPPDKLGNMEFNYNSKKDIIKEFEDKFKSYIISNIIKL